MADEFKFDLQRFADGGTEGGADDTTGGTEGDKGGKEPRMPRKPRPKKSRTRTYKNGLMMQ
mgnify:CR=1 FL=1